MDRIITAKECKEMREITGFGMIECKTLLERFGNIEDSVNYLRKNGDEPQYEGLTEYRFDVLDKEKNNVIFSCKTIEELRTSGYKSCFYPIRYVDRVGRYTYLK